MYSRSGAVRMSGYAVDDAMPRVLNNEHPFTSYLPIYSYRQLTTDIYIYINLINLITSKTCLKMTPRVLLLGGHGKIALHLTPLLLARSWNVTSVVRNHDHEAEILNLGANKPGKVSVLVASLDDVKSAADAQRILDSVRPEFVVWAAGNFTIYILPIYK